MTDTENAINILNERDCTCVFCKGESVLFSSERGVKPLLALIDGDSSLSGFSAADKVVGKAAAFLYVILGVKALHAKTVSGHALSVLEKTDIAVTYDVLVPAIRNRTNTGLCPMESAVLDITEPDLALKAIRARLKELTL